MDFQSIKYRNLFISFALILNGIISLVRLENKLISYSDCTSDPEEIEIESVLYEKTTYHFNNYLLKPSLKPIINHIDFPTIYKVLLIEYNNRVRHWFKCLERLLTPDQQLLLTLQKKHIWHQSSDNPSDTLS